MLDDANSSEISRDDDSTPPLIPVEGTDSKRGQAPGEWAKIIGQEPSSPEPVPFLNRSPIEETQRVRVIHRSAWRPVVESIAVLVIGVIVFRTFAAEAYVVPTGSMAPTLLGIHQDIVCTDCRHWFALGADEAGRSARPICPNCGKDLSGAPATQRNGDRLLVQKHFFDWRPPRRWEVVVFQNPAEAGQAFVKRVVGLPGEAVEIRSGDIYINGKLARKGLAEQQAMRILVHDNDHQPANASWFPRWLIRAEEKGNNQREPEAGGWLPEGSGFVYQPEPTEAGRNTIAWLEYRHQEPGQGGYGAVRDFTSYNGSEVVAEHRVTDVMLLAEVVGSTGLKALTIALQHRSDRYRVTLSLEPGAEGIRVERNGIPLPKPVGINRKALSSLGRGRPTKLEASVFDRRLLVALNGRLLFEPIDEPPGHGPPPGPLDSPIGLGVVGGPVEVRALKVYRDIYYTEGFAYAPARPFGVGSPYRLGSGEYFVLGDNSPVSNDSRFWPEGPVVRADLLLGKPFLVHLPSRGVPLRVFGDETYWVPDLREIRYIR